MRWDEKGFTLTEMLIVLTSFLILSTVGVVLLKPQYLMLERNTFFSQFSSDILYAQQYAISHQEIVAVNIMPESHYYYIRVDKFGGPMIVTRNYSKEIKLMKGTIPFFFHFSPSGRINQFGSFLVRCEGDTYRITFLIGMGRFYVTKE